jgi:hypothetical protein
MYTSLPFLIIIISQEWNQFTAHGQSQHFYQGQYPGQGQYPQSQYSGQNQYPGLNQYPGQTQYPGQNPYPQITGVSLFITSFHLKKTLAST